jgi:Uma2 family endonuclease
MDMAIQSRETRELPELPVLPVLAPGEVWTAERVRRELIDVDPESPLARFRFELIDGELLVTSAPEMQHQYAVDHLLFELMSYLRPRRDALAVTSPTDIEILPGTIVQPDVYVIPYLDGKRPRQRPYKGPLLLAIEVLSPSTARNDEVIKRRFYVRAGVEYWVVDLESRVVYRNAPGDERIDLCAERIAWRAPGAEAALTIDVEALFRAALDD